MAEGDSNSDGDKSVASRIADVRERLERRRKSQEAKKRAEARSERKGAKARERAEQERRIEQNNPANLSESAQATKQEVSLLASELGIGKEQARQVTARASQAIKQSGAQLDTDGDGDTDILEAIEDGIDTSQEAVEEQGLVPEPPVGDVEDDFDELELSGIEEEVGFESIEGELGGMFE